MNKLFLLLSLWLTTTAAMATSNVFNAEPVSPQAEATDVEDDGKYHLSIVSINKIEEENKPPMLTIVVHNDGATTYQRTIGLQILDYGNNFATLPHLYELYHEIPAGESVPFVFELDYLPEGWYWARPWWCETYETTQYSQFPESGDLNFFYINAISTGIDGVTADKAENTPWYTLSGRKIQKPTGKGVYIHNGKKIVVK